MAIEFIKYLGYDSVKLSFNNYAVTIMYSRGCNIIEFSDMEKELSLLHFPEIGEETEFAHSSQRFGSAILFPPNKIDGGKFHWNGIDYSLCEHNIPNAHGLLKEFPFTLTDSLESENFIKIKFSFNSEGSVYFSEFKWLFECTFEYELSDKGLSQQITISNNGDTEIPFGIGFHTAFRIPQNDNFQKEDYTIQVSCGERWELDSRSYPTGNLIPLSQDYNNGTVLPLAAPIAVHTKALTYENGFHGAIITNKRTNSQFIYETDSAFTNWMIWNNKASDNYICIEPMTCIINAPNVPLPHSATGFTDLKPGVSWTAKNKMHVKY